MPKKPKLIIIAGPNGSGKTTTTEALLRHQWGQDAIYINPDNIAKDMFGDWNSTEAVLKAAKYCDELREKLLSKKEDMVFETVFSSPGKLEFVKRAKDAGYFIRIFYIGTENPEINAARIARRYMHGGHTVPIDKVVDRYFKSLANIASAAAIADRVYIYDNSVNNQKACLYARTIDGQFIKTYSETMPLWVKEICRKLNFRKLTNQHSLTPQG